MKSTYVVALALLTALPIQSFGYERDKNYIKIVKSKRVDPYDPEKALSKFNLPEGFVIELVASEKNGIINPIDLTFDDAGRLWTQTAEMYPEDPFGDLPNRVIRGKLMNPNSGITDNPNYKRLLALYKLEKRGTDRILMIDDPTKQVVGQVPAVAEGLTMPQSILPYKNGVFVAHGAEMLFIEDADGDGKYEKAKSVLSGFSFIDSHTMSHSLVRGPGGWVHFSHGAMNLGEVTANASGVKQKIHYSKIARFSLDGEKLELVSSGLNNIWGFQLRADGQWYGTEANDKSHSVVPMEPGSGFLGIGNDKLRDYQPMIPVVHKFRVGGTGISGLVFSDDDANTFPKEWQNVAFLANPITNTINTVRVTRDADGKIIGEHLEDLLKSEDDWFRPVNMEFGPDGCLYIADWYNKIVSHNEVPRTDPTRDKTHGRIWRIRHESQKSLEIPNLIKTADADLAKHLLGITRWEKRAAWHQIVDRQVKSALPEVKEIALNKENTIGSRIHAIFAYGGLGEYDETFITALLSDSDDNVRREAIASMAFAKPSAVALAALVKPLLNDKHATVRSQVLRTLEEAQLKDEAIVELLVDSIQPDIEGNAFGGPYERTFERFLARKALETYGPTLEAFLNSEKAMNYDVDKLLWASQALDKGTAKGVFVKFWKMRGDSALDDETYVSLSSMLGGKEVASVVAPYFNNPDNFGHILNLTVKNESRLAALNLTKVLEPALKSWIKSTEKKDKKLAIKVAALVKSSAITAEVLSLVEQSRETSVVNSALSILAINPKSHQNLYKELSTDDKLAFSTRLSALDSFNRLNTKEGAKMFFEVTKSASEGDKLQIVKRLSLSPQGAKLLVKMYNQKLVKEDHFDFTSAQSLRSRLRKDKTAQAIFSVAAKIEKSRVKKLDQRVEHYVKAIETMKGNPEIGKGIFASCLTCHAVGEKGFDIAPALDGSAARELHALVTAIVNPDVAVEGGYNLHRVVKTDGSVIEGYLYQDNAQGLTIAGRGNLKTFIPKGDISSEIAVTGKSFMPSEFSQWPDQMMVDLVSYIKTLE